MAAKGVDEHLKAFPALRDSICAMQQFLNPSFGQSAVGLIQRVAYDCRADGFFGHGVGVLDGDLAIFGVFGPENVVEGN